MEGVQMTEKQRITGLGGFFFRAEDTKALAAWYDENFGIDQVPSDYGTQPWHQNEGPTVFAPFSADTTYFGEDMSKTFMLNFRVENLEKMVAQLRSNGNEVAMDEGNPYPNGLFANVVDPEGNPIQLWEPQHNPS
jgi:predicted enzyme related to lactoylglutathione lyase